MRFLFILFTHSWKYTAGPNLWEHDSSCNVVVYYLHKCIQYIAYHFRFILDLIFGKYNIGHHYYGLICFECCQDAGLHLYWCPCWWHLHIILGNFVFPWIARKVHAFSDKSTVHIWTLKLSFPISNVFSTKAHIHAFLLYSMSDEFLLVVQYFGQSNL